MTRPLPAETKSSADVEQLAQHPVSFARVAGLFRPHRKTIWTVVALIVATSGLTVAQPFLVRRAVDDAIPNHNAHLLVWLVVALIGLTVLSQVIGVLQTWLASAVGQRIMHELRTQVFDKLQQQSLGFFTRNRSGDVQSRLTNDIAGMRGVVTTTATSVATNLTMSIATIFAMVALSPRLSLLSLIVIPPAVWLTRQTAIRRRAITAQNQEAQAQLQQTISENLSVSGVRLTKTLGAAERVRTQFTEVSERLIHLELESQLAGRWRMATMQIIFGVIPALIYLVAGLSPNISIGTLIAFSTLQAQIFRPITGLLNVSAQWVASMALFSRIFEYLDLTPDLPEPATDPAGVAAVQLSDAGAPEVRFIDVSYFFPSGQQDGEKRGAAAQGLSEDGRSLALSHVSFDIAPGTTTALVGHTGSGKSTVAALMGRLADPTEGIVTLGGVDLRQLDARTRAGLIGVVSQETYLLHDTVRANLLFAAPEASEEDMWNALALARVDDVVRGLPEGLDTMVGSRGYRFSGGEQQRISLARTLLRNPQVLILDEATSALDNQTERAIQQAIVNSRATRLVIAHRLSTVQDAEQIVVLEAGRVVEKGTHTQLIARGGAYAALVAAAEFDGAN